MRLEWKALPMFALVMAMFSMEAASAQDLAGSWQGTLEGRAAKLRVIFQMTAVGNGWSGQLISIDQTPDWSGGIPFDSVTVQKENVNVKVLGNWYL